MMLEGRKGLEKQGKIWKEEEGGKQLQETLFLLEHHVLP